MSVFDESLGSQLVAARKARGMNQKQAAEFIGVSPNTLGSMERGGGTHASSLRKALDAYGLTVESTSPVPWQAKPAVDMVATWIGGLPEGRRSAAIVALGEMIDRFGKGKD